VAHRLSEEERQRILLTCNEKEFAALPPPGRSCRSWRIGACISIRRAASTGCCTPMDKPIAAVGHGHHRSRAQYRDCVRQARIRCEAGTSPISPPRSAESGFTSIWRTGRACVSGPVKDASNR
jgi:hypothetical protein